MGGFIPGLSLASGGFQTIFGTPLIENALLQTLPSCSHGILPVQTSGSLSNSQPLLLKYKDTVRIELGPILMTSYYSGELQRTCFQIRSHLQVLRTLQDLLKECKSNRSSTVSLHHSIHVIRYHFWH